MPTITEIAKRAGVAVSTVSYALNNSSKISPATKKRILEIAVEMGYDGNSGRGVRTSNNILAVFHNYAGSIMDEILSTMNDTLRENGYRLFFTASDSLPDDKFFCGMMILNSKISDRDIVAAADGGMPIVTLDRYIEHERISCVTLDNFKNVYTITSRLIEDEGCTTFAFISGPVDSYDSNRRYKGFRQAVLDHKIPESRVIVVNSDFTREGGARATNFIRSTAPIPDAFVCANDELAFGVVDTLGRMSIDRVIHISGFDAHPLFSTEFVNNRFRFLTVRVRRDLFGSTAALTMATLLRSGTVRRVTVQTTIVRL